MPLTMKISSRTRQDGADAGEIGRQYGAISRRAAQAAVSRKIEGRAVVQPSYGSAFNTSSPAIWKVCAPDWRGSPASRNPVTPRRTPDIQIGRAQLQTPVTNVPTVRRTLI